MKYILRKILIHPYARSLAAALVILAVGEAIHWVWAQRDREQLRHELVLRATEIKGQLETKLNANLHLTSGLKSYVHASNGKIKKGLVRDMLADIHSRGQYVRNIGIAPDNKITVIYPLAGNQSALGLRYEELPDQWPAVRRAIRTRQPTLAGPINLVQGGSGIIFRIPVYLANGKYWGIISLVLDLDKLLEQPFLNPAKKGAPEADKFDIQLSFQGLPLVRPLNPVDTARPAHTTGIRVHHEQMLLTIYPGPALTGKFSWPFLFRVLNFLLAVLVFWLVFHTVRTGIRREKAEKEALRRQKEVRDARESKFDFLARLSHEVRTPLNSLLGFSQLLTQTEVSTEQSQYVESIETAGQTLLQIMNDVLDVSRIETGRMEISQRPFAAAKLLEDIRQVGEGLLNRLGTPALRIQTQADILLKNRILLGDSVRIQQVLINLLTNSIKFSEQGTISIRIDQVSRPDSGKTENGEHLTIRFSIQDEGIGFSPADQEKIFEPFYQTRPVREKETRLSGYGLGLSVAFQLVQAMGGRLELQSKLGHGSRFWFDLQMAVQEDRRSRERSGPEHPMDLSKHCILLVEDNEANRLLAETVLRRAGATIINAAHGQEALDKLNPEIDLILMDIQMPVMDGITATKKIRAMRQYHRLPIIALTANVSQDLARKYRKAGMNGLIGKPFNLGALIMEVSRLVD